MDAGRVAAKRQAGLNLSMTSQCMHVPAQHRFVQFAPGNFTSSPIQLVQSRERIKPQFEKAAVRKNVCDNNYYCFERADRTCVGNSYEANFSGTSSVFAAGIIFNERVKLRNKNIIYGSIYR